MKSQNYFQIHKNKKPKKAKYSDFYTKQQKIGISKLITYFDEQTAILKIKLLKSI